jgi:hypothetical protein
VSSRRRFLFVCAGAEPGGDGVGDYARRLAGELERCGHAAALLALDDRNLGAGLERGVGELRLSHSDPWKVRLRDAGEFLKECRPDVLSLQYVGYGFDPRGLPLGLAAKLQMIAKGKPWHVMFHELWIKPDGGWRFQILSRLQKAHVADLCQVLRPGLVHTSNQNYAARLADAGIPSSVLPLFSNIELAPADKNLRSNLVWGIDPRLDPDGVWIFVFFGSIHPGWDTEKFLERVAGAARRAGKQAAIFLSLGKNPGRGAEIWDSMQCLKMKSLHFLKVGGLPVDDVSRHLQAADFGIATTPLGLLGKSGSAAAIASHGLTMIATRVDVALESGILQEAGILPVDDFFEAGLLNPPKPHGVHSVRAVADLFLQQVQPLLEKP